MAKSTMTISGLLRHHLFKKIFGLTVLLYLSPVVGLLVDVVFIRRFGAGEVMDLYRVLMSFVIMGNGLLSAQLFKFVVIPQLAKYKNDGQDGDGLRFAERFTAVVFVIILPIVCMGVFAPSVMLDFLAPGMAGAMTSQSLVLTQIATIGFAATTFVGALSSVLNFYGNFWGQPLGQILLNATVVAGLMLFGYGVENHGAQIELIGYAMASGIFLMVVVCVIPYLGIRKRCMQNGHSNHSLKTSFLVILPLLLPQFVLLGSEMYKPVLINRTLSYMDAGAVALYLLAYRLLMLGSLPVQSVLTVLFPNMASRNISEDAGAVLNRFVKVTTSLFVSTALCSAALYLFAHIIVMALSLLSDLDDDKADVLVRVYRLLLFFAPFGAIGNHFIQTAYASKLRSLVMAYSLGNVALLALFLPMSIGNGAEGVASIFVSVQSASFVVFGLVLYAFLFWRTKK